MLHKGADIKKNEVKKLKTANTTHVIVSMKAHFRQT